MSQATKLKIKKWLVTGELSGEAKTSADLIEEACNVLDDNSATEIFGQNVFQASNGKFYAVFVEAQIREVDKDHADQIVSDEGDE